MTYIVRAWRGIEFVEDTLTSKTAAQKVFDQRRAEDWSQVALLYPPPTPAQIFGIWSKPNG